MPKTKIEWADDTENIAGGCTEARFKDGRMDPACANCYARLMSARHSAMSEALGRSSIYDGVAERRGAVATWTGKLTWDRDLMRRRFQAMKGGHRVFLGSMTDLWHPDHDPALLVALAEEIRALGDRPPEKRPSVITLTKRADRLLAWQRAHFPEGLPAWHWPGVTAGCQEAVNERIPLLIQVVAEGPRVVSVEPMTGPVKLLGYLMDGKDPGACKTCGQGHGFTRCPNYGGIARVKEGWKPGGCGCMFCRSHRPCDNFVRANRPEIGWVITGGESGPKARPSHPDWFRALRDECQKAVVPYLHKQHGEWVEVDPDGRDPVTGGPVMRDPDDPNDAATFIKGLSAGIAPDGDVALSLDAMEEGVAYRHVQRVGKKAAGRLLDGREWNEVPTQP